MKNENYFTASRMSVIAVFSALAFALYLVRIPMAFAFAPWLELNLSDIPAFIGTFALGPVAGCIIVTVKILLKLIVQGTGTVFVGEFADLIIGYSLVIPCGLIYKKHRSVKGAIVALAVGSIISTLCAILANRVLLIPFYANQWGLSTLAGMLTGLFPSCTEENFYSFYLWASVLPFNLLRCIVSGVITFFVYKRVSRLVKRIGEKFDPVTGTAEETPEAQKVRSRKSAVWIIVFVGVLLVLIGGVLLRYFLT